MRNVSIAVFVTFAAVLLSLPALAAEKTVVLDVKNANCVLCPPIVRQSLLHVHGVKDVKMSQANRMADFMATIIFDDGVTNETALIAATGNAGYPAHVVSTN